MTGNPLVASAGNTPTDAWAGVWIVEDIEQISRGVSGGGWIDATLGSVGAGLDGLAVVSDPVSALLQYGIAWIIEHVRPLSQALDWLAGDPAQIKAHAQTWRNIAVSLTDEATGLSRAVVNDVEEWTGLAADAYRVRAERLTGALRGLASAAGAMASITEAAGVLIAGVRVMVRDAIAACVARLIVYAAEEAASLGLATPLVVEQVTTTVAAWAARIGKWLRALLSSLHRLQPIIRRLGELIDELKKILGRLRDRPDGSSGTRQPPEEPKVPRGSDHPDFSNPDIDSKKITDYAMNPDHSVGGNKYQVIHSATGLEATDAALIEQQIREGVREGTPILGRADQYGQRWAVDVRLTGSTGTLVVRTAWILDVGSTTPRLVTISLP